MAWTLHRTEITGGLYRGLLVGSGAPPDLEMALDGQVIGPMTAAKLDHGWQIEGEMGTGPLTDGSRTVVVRTVSGDILDSVTIVTGLSAPEDLRAELSVLRAEISLLKAAIRRLNRT
ncbi:hypothetical protein [Jannaschia pohangensis]|uniref:Uncharacterized protein n=1 Tax=Jannaschia pohangensis TaxID=390807 RepID=A0A1I3U412_9RHOB|nr:hypothetical protein [Jannaschia pohangensis]SFJ77740.1 hypothetical protein SAMN04488095_3619 [Jannaschia pohangensis]